MQHTFKGLIKWEGGSILSRGDACCRAPSKGDVSFPLGYDTDSPWDIGEFHM